MQVVVHTKHNDFTMKDEHYIVLHDLTIEEMKVLQLLSITLTPDILKQTNAFDDLEIKRAYQILTKLSDELRNQRASELFDDQEFV